MMLDVADAYRVCRKEIEAKFNSLISEDDLLPQVDKWAFIAILRDDENSIYQEVVKRSGNGKVLEFRLKISYVDFRDGNASQRMGLIFDALLRSIDLMAELCVLLEDREKLKGLLLKTKRELTSD